MVTCVDRQPTWVNTQTGSMFEHYLVCMSWDEARMNQKLTASFMSTSVFTAAEGTVAVLTLVLLFRCRGSLSWGGAGTG